MNVALRRPMVLDEFLDWERGQELRLEFDGVQPRAMTGGTVAHSVVATNLVRALQDRLAGGPRRAFRGDLKVVVAGRVRYPDAVVTCSPVADDADIVPEPDVSIGDVVLGMPEIGVEIPLAAVYAGLDLSSTGSPL